VYLDMRHLAASHPEKDLKARFPGISKFLAGYGLELAKDLIPVRPAAHYLMGGIKADVDGRTSLEGLYAAGEAACTGVHGANRLASNSLLEGLVFGALAAEEMIVEFEDMDEELGEQGAAKPMPKMPPMKVDAAAIERWIAELRAVMWKDAGLLRDRAGLTRAKARLEGMMGEIPRGFSRRAVEARNLWLVASVMVESALGREESRGAHYRNDFPKRSAVARHSVMEKGKLRFEA